MTRRRSRLIAWVSVLATLFSAVSPAIAAVVLAERPAALARMLGIPETPKPPAHEAHFSHAAPDHGTAPANSDGDAPHANHGIYCAFCLNASSTLAIAAVPALPLVAVLTTERDAVESQQSFTTAFRPVFRSRAPPR